jgi:glucose/arabinose dehydrogenase
MRNTSQLRQLFGQFEAGGPIPKQEEAPMFSILRLTAATALATAASTIVQAQDAQSPMTDQEIGKRFEVRAEDLPKPYADEAVRNAPKVIPRNGEEPRAPQGFSVSLFAEGLKHPRKLLVLENGDVLLAEQDAGYITFLRDENGDGKADTVSRFADGFEEPYGMAVVPDGEHKGHILVADAQGIWRVPFKMGGIRPDMGNLLKQGGEATGPQTPADHIAVTEQGIFGPVQGHTSRALAVDPKDGALYVGVGSMGNIAEEPEMKASIQVFDADGKNQRTFASGMRNPTGIHFHPDTGELWAVVQERDGLGNQLVPDYMTRVTEGDFYGWPYAYIGGKPMPDFAERAPDKVEQTKMPDLLFEAHSSAMDFAFVPDSWPEEYRGDAIVVLKGSWNRADPTGYKLVRAGFSEGAPEGWYDNFLTGFWTEGDARANVWGRPASVAFLPDGGLLVADDSGGTIWKVSPADPVATGATEMPAGEMQPATPAE